MLIELKKDYFIYISIIVIGIIVDFSIFILSHRGYVDFENGSFSFTFAPLFLALLISF